MSLLRRYARFGWLAVSLVLTAGLFGGCTIPVPSVEPLTTIEPVEQLRVLEADGADRARIRLRLVSDDLMVRGGAQLPILLRGKFRYNVEAWEPNIDQTNEEGQTRVTVSQGLGSQIPIGQSDTYQNAWEIALAPSIPTDLGIDMGSGDANLALGGLSLTDLSVTAGSTDMTLGFDAPNPEPMGLLRLTSGTGSFAATGLGNANFDRLSLIGGTGRVDLDFSGALRRSAVVDLKAGAGRITLRVPGSVGARATVSGTPLRTLDLQNFTESGDNTYTNPAYGEAPLTLTLRITAGIGQIVLISY